MELILKDLTVKSVKKDQIIKKTNYTFKDKNITFCFGISGKILRDLLFMQKKQTSGYIYVSEKGLVSDIGYIGNNPSKEFQTKTFREEIIKINDEFNLQIKDIDVCIKKILMFVGLDESKKNHPLNNLSTTEQKKLTFAKCIITNPKIIILDFYEKGLTYLELNRIKKMLLKFKLKYNKNIIICSDNLEKYLNTIDNFIIFKEGTKVLEGTSKDLYNTELYKYIEMPSIISFIKKVQGSGHNISNYLDLKELIKAIYRDVEMK